MEQETMGAERFMRAMRRMGGSFRRAGHVEELTRGGFEVLMQVRRHEVRAPGTPLRIGELSGQMERPTPAISRWVGELESRGLLRRYSGSDRRTVCVELTEQGRALLEQSWNRILGTVDEMLSALGTDGPRLIELMERADGLFRVQNGEQV